MFGARSIKAAMLLVSSFRADEKTALRFFRKMFKRQGTPRKIVTDKLRSYGAAGKKVMPSILHCQVNIPIIARKAHISIQGSKNDKYEDSNRPDKRSDFSPYIAKSTICLTLVVIY